MQHPTLWAPWRMDYIRQLDESRPPGSPPTPPPPGCFLCEAARVAPPSDEARRLLVLHRDERGIILLNRYPYTNGHLLVAPTGHLPLLGDLSPEARAGLIELTALAEKLLMTAVNPQGLNVGVNIGRCAGAGLPGHLHVHVVPRWNGDTNFMPVVGHVRVVPQALDESYGYLAEMLGKLQGGSH